MFWHYRIRAIHGERMASRLLQVLETQRVHFSYFRVHEHGQWCGMDVILEADADKAQRIGHLLRRIDRLPSVVWRSCERAATMESDPFASTAYAMRAYRHTTPDLDPLSDFWRTASSVFLNRNPFGFPATGHETEVRFSWTESTLCLLFDCKYDALHLRTEEPVLAGPTQELWEHDVAEIFIAPDMASDGASPRRYAEFEVSPRGEWLALQIETLLDGEPQAVPIQSGFHCDARIQQEESHWIALMQIPFSAIMDAQPAAGMRFRMNLYRSQGPVPVEVAWRPTFHQSFHVPSSFGDLFLLD